MRLSHKSQMSIKLPKKGLRIAHLNINNLKNKVHELSCVLLENALHITAISETHLDECIEDTEVEIQGYNIFRYDRNKYGGGVAFYIQNHLPVKIRTDLSAPGLEVL